MKIKLTRLIRGFVAPRISLAFKILLAFYLTRLISGIAPSLILLASKMHQLQLLNRIQSCRHPMVGHFMVKGRRVPDSGVCVTT